MTSYSHNRLMLLSLCNDKNYMYYACTYACLYCECYNFIPITNGYLIYIKACVVTVNIGKIKVLVNVSKDVNSSESEMEALGDVQCAVTYNRYTGTKCTYMK